MPRWLIRISRHLGALVATVVLGGILTAALVRGSPGFDADERMMDPRLDAQSRALIQAEHASDHDVLRFYLRYVGAMLRGDWGVSRALNAPIRELVRSRLPVTAEIMAIGVAGGWILAFGFALAAVHSRFWSRLGGTLGVVLLSLPSAALAVLIFTTHGPIRAAT